MNKTGHAEHRVATENRRVKEIVVNAPVNDVDRLKPFGRAHEDMLVAHEQVAAFDNFNAHLPRQIRVLEIRAVVGAGREQHHASDPPRRRARCVGAS